MRQFVIAIILLISISSFSQSDTTIQQKHKKKFSIAAESGMTISYPDRVVSNGTIQGLRTIDPYIGILASFKFDNVAFETGLMFHANTSGASINDPIDKSSFSTSSDASAYFRIPFRISYEFQSGFKGFSVEPFAGVSKLITRHSGVYNGFSGSSIGVDNGDTTNSTTEAFCIHPLKSVWTTNVGVKIKYTYKKLSFCLIGEFFSSNSDWNIVDVIYNRNSSINGVLTDNGRVYSKAKSLCFGAYVSFSL